MPALLRHARLAYSVSMRKALDLAGYGDIPKNGLYVIGGLARESGAHPLSELIEELRLSKQAAGQLIETLVARGYLKRDVDSEDRRRLTIGLTEQGRAAATVLSVAGASVDEALLSRIGPRDLERTRRTLFALVDIATDDGAERKTEVSHLKGRATMEITNRRESLDVRNSDLAQSRFSDAKLSFSCFDDVNLEGSTFNNINLGSASFNDVNLSNVSIKHANIAGMKINDVLVTELIRVYESRSK